MPRFFDQNLKLINLSDGRTGASFKFENMIKQETELLYAFKGAYTYLDLQEMTDYEFMLVSEAYKDIKETEKIAMERAKQSNGNDEILNAPINLPNSRFNLPKEDEENKGTEN